MVYFEFWSHEKIEYRSHEIRPPDPESQLVIICSIAECSAAVRKLFPSKSYSNISWIFFYEMYSEKCTVSNLKVNFENEKPFSDFFWCGMSRPDSAV